MYEMPDQYTRPAGRPDSSYFKERGAAFWTVHSILIGTSALLVVWLILSCKEVQPREIQERINRTRAVLVEARRHDAERYAPDAMRLAEGSFKHAIAEVAAQERRIFPFGSYELAKQHLGRAKQAAYGAIFEASAEREKARQDALMLIGEVRDFLQSSMEVKAKLRNGTKTTMALENLASTLADANWAYQSGDYLTARAKAKRLLLQIEELESWSPTRSPSPKHMGEDSSVAPVKKWPAGV